MGIDTEILDHFQKQKSAVRNIDSVRLYYYVLYSKIISVVKTTLFFK